MKPLVKSALIFISGFFLIFLLLQQCNQTNDQTYQSLMSYADQVKVINTHEHQRWPEENGDLTYRLIHLIHSSYLMSDVVSAGGQRMDWERLDTITLNEYWKVNGEALDFTRNTSYYSHFIKGFQKLYDFSDLYFKETNFHNLSAQVEENYRDYREWFDEAFRKANFELMFLDQYWKPFSTDVVEPYYALVFHINELVMHSSNRPDEEEELSGIYEKAREDGFTLSALDEYLNYCNQIVILKIYLIM